MTCVLVSYTSFRVHYPRRHVNTRCSLDLFYTWSLHSGRERTFVLWNQSHRIPVKYLSVNSTERMVIKTEFVSRQLTKKGRGISSKTRGPLRNSSQDTLVGPTHHTHVGCLFWIVSPLYGHRNSNGALFPSF